MKRLLRRHEAARPRREALANCYAIFARVKRSACNLSVSRRLASQNEVLLHFSCTAGALHCNQRKKDTFTQFLIRILTAYRRYSVCRTDSFDCPSYSVLGFRQLLRASAYRYSESRCLSAALRFYCALPFFRG